MTLRSNADCNLHKQHCLFSQFQQLRYFSFAISESQYAFQHPHGEIPVFVLCFLHVLITL